LGLADNHTICDTRFGHGKEPKIFWSPLGGERVTLFMSFTSEVLIQMGDWYSED
jgi:hypothetical protein